MVIVISVPSHFERAMNVALVADHLHMQKAICNVLQHVDLRPLPVREGPRPSPRIRS